MNEPIGARPTLDLRPGLLVAAVLLCVYGGIAVSVDFPRVAFGIQSDEATYYMMGHSLAEDHDLVYERKDLERVSREFSPGPTGVFLKRGGAFSCGWADRFPYINCGVQPVDPASRLFYGKSYIYPLVAWPFVAALGTNGFLVLNALLLAAAFFGAYLFVLARAPAWLAALVSSGFILASVAPTYFVWITPELFNVTLVILGYVCWLFREVASPEQAPTGTRWLFGNGGDLAAAVLLGMVTFSKPSNLLLVLPLLGWLAVRRRWRLGLVVGLVFGTVGAVLLAGNIAVSGEWNYQGGERRTYYGPYPMQQADVPWDAIGQGKTTDRIHTEIIFNRRVFGTVLAHNVVYFFVGRHAGLVPYFFPGVFAAALFLWRWRRPAWQWMIAAVILAEILLLLIWVPYTYNGGGGSIGNRYYMNTYGAMLFLLPALQSVWVGLVPWIVGTLFCAHVTFNPFFASYNPWAHATKGLLRWLPVELTLVNDLPINTRPERARVWFGQQRRFQIYFLDDNAYQREGLFFWTRGRSTAEMLVKTVEPTAGLQIMLQAGSVDTSVVLRWRWWSETVTLRADESRTVTVPFDAGMPYNGTRVWRMAISTHTGFVPAFDGTGGGDHRYLGVRVTPELLNIP